MIRERTWNFTNSSGVLVSYDVNANNSTGLVCANDYKPRFIRVAIPGLIGPLEGVSP